MTRLFSLLHRTSILATGGAEGLSLFRLEPALHIARSCEERVRHCWIGRTLAFALATGATLGKAASLANTAAGIVVGKVGATVRLAEPDAELSGGPSST